ncbi:MAG: hypothetical protein CYG59_22535 [Chloroflexi bacterium]|nr:MAG: hypothetical protein CYG59_22535 [Chloroflexota bacterium]
MLARSLLERSIPATIRFHVAVAAPLLFDVDAPALSRALVNNAGVAQRRPVGEIGPADWNVVVDTLLKGTFLITHATLPTMIAAKRGNIIRRFCRYLNGATERPGIETGLARASHDHAGRGCASVPTTRWSDRQHH